MRIPADFDRGGVEFYDALNSPYCEDCGHHENCHGPDGCSATVELTGVKDEGEENGAQVICGCMAGWEDDYNDA